jgi:hypothetical protein
MKTKLNQKQDNLLWIINNGLSISTHNAKYDIGNYSLQDMHTLDWNYAVYSGYATAAKNFVKLLRTFKR